ncbi:MAG: winged helix-turn-helix transcriptional regulator [Tenericutes bacterium]|nr:winged helix-turn-helix transcriptional regulator [Mycoplasmatota bacterium]
MKRNEYDHGIHKYRFRYLNERISKLNVSGPQAQYLVKMLHSGGKVLMNDMVGESAYHKSHTTRAINELEENGLVTKEKNPDDKRGYLLYLTEKGKETAKGVHIALEEFEDFVNTVVTDEERETIKNITKKVYHLLRTYYDEEDIIDENSI